MALEAASGDVMSTLVLRRPVLAVGQLQGGTFRVLGRRVDDISLAEEPLQADHYAGITVPGRGPDDPALPLSVSTACKALPSGCWRLLMICVLGLSLTASRTATTWSNAMCAAG